MMDSWIELSILPLGFAAAALLFWRIPRLPNLRNASSSRVSIIIPARNEAQTLPLLLADLMNQSFQPLEVLVADDGSEDNTAQLARSFGANVLSLPEKPENWIGKNWACHQGARSARGDVFVFLDADVRLSIDGLCRIVRAYETYGTISVQPYHVMQKAYEQCALFFNLVQIGANGNALPKSSHIGLFGPVIAISRADYRTVGGHESVRSDVVEDMALARNLRRANIPYSVFVGDEDISFRMYPAGFHSLWQGFTKNFATSAARTPIPLFLFVSLFLASAVSVPLHLFLSLTRGESLALFYGALYLLWAVVLFVLGRRIGRFSLMTAILYPLPLAVFLLVFFHSAFLRLFHGKVRWKGRVIKPER